MNVQTKASEHYSQRTHGRVYYKKLGEGEPVIFLHACPVGAWSFDNVLPAFARYFTCYAVDLPGFDHSDLPPHKYSIPDFTEAIVDVMRDTRIERAHFVGSHTGAILSLNMAATHPERVSRIVVEDSPGWDLREGSIVYERFFRPQYDMDGLPRILSYEEAITRNPGLKRERHERMNAYLREHRDWFHICHQAHTGFDIANIMPHIQAPTLVIFAENNAMRRTEQRFVELITGSTLRILPGYSEAHEDSPDAFVSEVLDFLLK